MKISYQQIYDTVARIPEGRVATYGQIAQLAGYPRQARQIGYALAALETDELPWQRVINAQGEISPRTNPDGELIQRILLEEEGLAFDDRGRISLPEYQWRP
ncbi:MAG: MGMT family protein [Verrucomicrobiota bacterium]